MRFITFEYNGGQRLGVCDGGEIIDLSLAAPDLPTELVDLIKLGPSGLDRVRKAVAIADQSARVPLSNITYLPPTRRPSKIICLGLNYADHAAEGGHQKPEYPSFFMRGNATLVAQLPQAPSGGAQGRSGRAAASEAYDGEGGGGRGMQANAGRVRLKYIRAFKVVCNDRSITVTS